MLLWVVIYSYLPANFFSTTASFVYEVEVLFNNITFWATVVFSVMVADTSKAHAVHASDVLSSLPLQVCFLRVCTTRQGHYS